MLELIGALVIAWIIIAYVLPCVGLVLYAACTSISDEAARAKAAREESKR